MASLMFPKSIRDDVFVLYAFVRRADDLIDHIPPRIREFNDYRKATAAAISGSRVKDDGIMAFAELVRRKRIPISLIDDFFNAQERDAATHYYKTYGQLKDFVYGVAEVIGLLMAYVMGLPRKADDTARKLGAGMQLTNILRDIPEDLAMGRVYLPRDELKRFGLPDAVDMKTAADHRVRFQRFMKFQIKRSLELLRESRKGYKYIPSGYLLPIAASADLYEKTLRKLERDPEIIFKRKLKPSKYEIIMSLAGNFVRLKTMALLNFWRRT